MKPSALAVLLFAVGGGCASTAPDSRVSDLRLSAEFLRGTLPMPQPVDMQQFSAPSNNARDQPMRSGSMSWSRTTASGFDIQADRFDYAGVAGESLAAFPAATLQWAEWQGFVIPREQGILQGEHPDWELAFQPGRSWVLESGRRYAVPFALIERNANCTHNGVLTWVTDDDGGTSRIAYQIASETCPYLKFNMWGLLAGTYAVPGTTDDDDSLVSAFRQSRQARLPLEPFEALAARRTTVEIDQFGAVANVNPADTSVYGFVLDGVHYRSACPTRLGPYPFCDELLLPSYSTAKSIFASLALMRLEALVPGAANARISDLVPECAEGWDDITIGDALDMATGRYQSTGTEADEAQPEHVAFLYAENHAEKIRFACQFFPTKSQPGKVWVYHTSDTYVAGTAMRALLAAHGDTGDLYQSLVVRPLWETLALGQAIRTTRHTYDLRAQPLVGWGLYYQPDDIARIGNWLVNGAPLPSAFAIDPDLLAGAMQQAANDRGLVAGSDNTRYNNGFWGLDIASFIGCDKPVWVPFMSGHGGISVVLFPNRTVYYHFSDGYVHRWREAAIQSNRIRNMCQ